MCGADCGSNSSQRARPLSLATYIARSDWRSRSPARSSPPCEIAIADARRHEQLVLADRHRLAQALDHPFGDLRSRRRDRRGCASSRLNSSPPKRATMSPGRRHDCSRSATVTSRRSPTSWPRLSFTSLNRSTSRNSTATWRPLVARVEQRLLEPLEELPAVRQAGERVVVRLERQLLLRGAALADVAHVAHEPADRRVVEAVRHADFEPAERPVDVAQRQLDPRDVARAAPSGRRRTRSARSISSSGRMSVPMRSSCS